jgi:capsular exopolysaccharide synthesis family protein
MVTSATGHEGRTTVASQLAASLARAGRRTLLVDGDLRHPSLHMLFDVPLDDGLCEVLRTEAEIEDVVRPTHAEGLWLMTAGYCDVPAIQAMSRDQLQPIIEKLRNIYDFIIIDAAPALNLSDALIMGQYVDGAIVSVLRDVTKVPQLHQVFELLKSLNIPVFGSVVNGVRGQVDIRTERLHLIPPPQDEAEATADMSTEA